LSITLVIIVFVLLLLVLAGGWKLFSATSESVEPETVKDLPVSQEVRLDGRNFLIAGGHSELEAIKRWLCDKGAGVDIVENGQLAIQTFLHSSVDYDAVLLEREMPVMDGLKTARELRKVLQLNDLPVFGLTMQAEGEQRDDVFWVVAKKAGMNGVFVYPSEREKLLSVLAARKKLPSGF